MQQSWCQAEGAATLVCSGLKGGVQCWDRTLRGSSWAACQMVRDLKPAHRREGEEAIRPAAPGRPDPVHFCSSLHPTWHPRAQRRARHTGSAARWGLVQIREALKVNVVKCLHMFSELSQEEGLERRGTIQRGGTLPSSGKGRRQDQQNRLTKVQVAGRWEGFSVLVES